MKTLKILLLFISIVFIATACPGSTETAGCENSTDCDPGYVCNPNTLECEVATQTECNNADWCYANETDKNWNKETKPVKCDNKVCVVNCPLGQELNTESDKCEEIVATCDTVDHIKIVTVAPIFTEGATKQLKAIAYNRNNIATTYSEFAWATDDDSIVAIDQTGLATGGATSGTANITVSACGKNSEALQIQNMATLEAGKLRVILRDIEGGAVSGAKIKIGDAAPGFSDGSGVLIVENTEAKNTISIFAQGYQYVSLLDTTKKDIIVYLNQALDMTKAGGYNGAFDFSAETMPAGQVELGFAGTSLPGSFLDLNFSLLIGENIVRRVKVGTTIDDNYPVPSSITLKIGESIVSDKYEVTGLKGERVLWGFGGKLAMTDVLPLVNMMMGDGGLDLGPMLAKVTPLFQKMHFTTKDNFMIKTCPKVVDTNDYNNNGETTDMIPDFTNTDCFPTQNMKLDTELSQRTTVKFPALPTMEGATTEFAALLMGSNVEQKGFVPTGMGAGADAVDENDTADGSVDDTEVVYAPKTEGLVGSPVSTVVLTMPLAEQSNEPTEELPDVKMSGIVKYFEDGKVPATLDYSADTFLKLAEDAILNTAENKVSASDITGANLYRLQLVDVNGVKWVIYSPTATIQIPAALEAFNLTNFETVMFQAVKMSVSYDELLGFNDTNIDSFTKLMEAFSLYEITPDAAK